MTKDAIPPASAYVVMCDAIIDVTGLSRSELSPDRPFYDVVSDSHEEEEICEAVAQRLNRDLEKVWEAYQLMHPDGGDHVRLVGLQILSPFSKRAEALRAESTVFHPEPTIMSMAESIASERVVPSVLEPQDIYPAKSKGGALMELLQYPVFGVALPVLYALFPCDGRCAPCDRAEVLGVPVLSLVVVSMTMAILLWRLWPAFSSVWVDARASRQSSTNLHDL